MSQYSGNKTNGAFNPTYHPSGETNTPISVVSTSIEIQIPNGSAQLVEGYQATYANGTSKWTPHVLTDTPVYDLQNIDRSTFTGSKNADGEWVWKPTSDTNVGNLAQHYRGLDGERITADQIENQFYAKEGITLEQKLSGIQTLALRAKYKDNLATVNNGQFAGLQGLASDASEDRSGDANQSESGDVAGTVISFVDLEGQSTIKSTKTRTQYGHYYYPYDIRSNKQDRIIFQMRQSTGQVINPTDVTANIGSRKRRAKVIEGSVTLPITTGIKDSNMVDWGKDKMDPIQAFKATTALGMLDAATKEGETVLGALGRQLNEAGTVAKDKGVQKAISTMIAGAAAQTNNLLSRAGAAVANPNLELLFNGPGLRAFQFTFQMSPRDATEAAQVKSIINFFKQGMAVKTTSTNVFLRAPNYFEVDYVTFTNDGRMIPHPSINRIKKCALLSCSVDYTPNNTYMTYSDASRSMVSYTLDLQFGELDPLYESDYYDRPLAMENSKNSSTNIGY